LAFEADFFLEMPELIRFDRKADVVLSFGLGRESDFSDLSKSIEGEVWRRALREWTD